jgi:hypothetical protein
VAIKRHPVDEDIFEATICMPPRDKKYHAFNIHIDHLSDMVNGDQAGRLADGEEIKFKLVEEQD